jgi:hypothetical protein
VVGASGSDELLKLFFREELGELDGPLDCLDQIARVLGDNLDALEPLVPA